MRGELPITGELAVSAKTTREGKLAKVNKQTIKQIAATIATPQQRNSSDNSSDNSEMSVQLMREAETPPIKNATMLLRKSNRSVAIA